MSEPNTWTSATVLNNWGGTIANVQLKHRYDNDHYDDKSWDSIEDGKKGDSFQVGYWTGFGRTGYDYWLIKFEADGKVWTCKDNFYCFLTDDDKGGTVQCRVYKEGDAGKMEVSCPQSSHATVSLSSQPLPSTAKTAVAKPARTPVDGTLTPRGSGPSGPSGDDTSSDQGRKKGPFEDELAICERLPNGKDLIRLALKDHTLEETDGDTETVSTHIYIHRQSSIEQTVVRIMYEMQNAASQGRFEDIRAMVSNHTITPAEYAQKKLEIEADSAVTGARSAIELGVPFPHATVEGIVREYLLKDSHGNLIKKDGAYVFRRNPEYKNGKRIYPMEEMTARVAKTLGASGVTESGVSARDLYTKLGQEFWDMGGGPAQ